MYSVRVDIEGQLRQAKAISNTVWVQYEVVRAKSEEEAGAPLSIVVM
jgi:hypothetical protein